MLDLNVSLGNLITIGVMIFGGITTYIKQRTSQEAFTLNVTEKLDKIDNENGKQNNILNSQDIAIRLLTQSIDNKVKNFDEAIQYNKDWRHNVAAEFMRDTGLKVAMLDKDLSLLSQDFTQVKAEVTDIKKKLEKCPLD